MTAHKDGWISFKDFIIKAETIKAVFFRKGSQSSESSLSSMRISYFAMGSFHATEVIVTESEYQEFCKLVRSQS